MGSPRKLWQKFAYIQSRHAARNGAVRPAILHRRFRFHIEGIEVTRPAPQPQQDHRLRWRLSKPIRRSHRFATQHIRQTHPHGRQHPRAQQLPPSPASTRSRSDLTNAQHETNIRFLKVPDSILQSSGVQRNPRVVRIVRDQTGSLPREPFMLGQSHLLGLFGPVKPQPFSFGVSRRAPIRIRSCTAAT